MTSCSPIPMSHLPHGLVAQAQSSRRQASQAVMPKASTKAPRTYSSNRKRLASIDRDAGSAATLDGSSQGVVGEALGSRAEWGSPPLPSRPSLSDRRAASVGRNGTGWSAACGCGYAVTTISGCPCAAPVAAASGADAALPAAGVVIAVRRSVRPFSGGAPGPSAPGACSAEVAVAPAGPRSVRTSTPSTTTSSSAAMSVAQRRLGNQCDLG